MKGGRPARPDKEVKLVWEAVSKVNAGAPKKPLAQNLARLVVAELEVEIDGITDPLKAGLADIRRRTFSSAINKLATDPDVDTLALFVDRRVKCLKARSGASLSSRNDEIKRRRILDDIKVLLARRYLRHLRTTTQI